MKPGKFRFEAILNVYQNQEDIIKQEIANLEMKRKRLRQKVADLFDKSKEVQDNLRSAGTSHDAVAILEYIEGIKHWIKAARNEEDALEKKIVEQLDVLKEIRTERMRFGKLKERHQKEVQKSIKMEEQKVMDEFAQRKRNL